MLCQSVAVCSVSYVHVFVCVCVICLKLCWLHSAFTLADDFFICVRLKCVVHTIIVKVTYSGMLMWRTDILNLFEWRFDVSCTV